MSTRRLLSALAASALAAAAVPAVASAGVQVGASGWQWGNPLPQGNTLRAMSFAPGGTGYAAGDFGTLLKTVDGGTTWAGLRVGTFTNLTTVQAVDASTVVAGGAASPAARPTAGRPSPGSPSPRSRPRARSSSSRCRSSRPRRASCC